MLEFAGGCPVGAFVEVGVWRGGSAWHLMNLAQAQGRRFYAYDTFQGIPFQIPGLDTHPVGDFKDVVEEEVRSLLPEATVIAGVFPRSAVEMGSIAFAHLDCDAYKSVKDSLIYLAPRMARGGIIWFDDAPCLAGAKAAAEEFCGKRLKTSYNGKYFSVF
jgi:hypothetical protein